MTTSLPKISSFRKTKTVTKKVSTSAFKLENTPREDKQLLIPLSGVYSEDMEYLQNFIANDELKNSQRTKEFREYIDQISSKYSSRDFSNHKENINSIFNQIMQNISLISEKSKTDITAKKKDIENRVNIRLMDSEFKHKTELKEAIKEQENFLRNVNSMTQEMNKIKDNFDAIKKKINFFFTKNDELKRMIAVEQEKYKVLERYLYTYKRVTRLMKNKMPEEKPKDLQNLVTDVNLTTSAGYMPIVFTEENVRLSSARTATNNKAIETFKSILNGSKGKLKKLKIKVGEEQGKKNKTNERIMEILAELGGGSEVKNFKEVSSNKRRTFLEILLNDEKIKEAVNIEDIKSELEFRK